MSIEERQQGITHNKWRRESLFGVPQPHRPETIGIAIDLAIEALGDGWISVDAKEDEFTELLDMARRMQQLYRNGKFGLSDEEMTRATAHLDDLRRIPSPPKPKQP